MNKIVIGAYYTSNTPYKQIYEQYLLPSCKKFSLKLVSMEIETKGNWFSNTAEKPCCILKILDMLKKDETLVFLDVDCNITKYPDLFERIPDEYDIAYHTLSWNQWYGYKNNPDVKELLTGTMMLRNRPIIKTLCEEWYTGAITSNKWEQKVLQEIIEKYINKKLIKVYHLPLSYCSMISRPRNQPPLVDISEAVILHHQASRELKKRM